MSGGMLFKVRNLSPIQSRENRISGEKLLHIPVNLGHLETFSAPGTLPAHISPKSPSGPIYSPPTFLLGRFSAARWDTLPRIPFMGWRGVLGVLFGQIDCLIDADADGDLPSKHNLQADSRRIAKSTFESLLIFPPFLGLRAIHRSNCSTCSCVPMVFFSQ